MLIPKRVACFAAATAFLVLALLLLGGCSAKVGHHDAGSASSDRKNAMQAAGRDLESPAAEQAADEPLHRMRVAIKMQQGAQAYSLVRAVLIGHPEDPDAIASAATAAAMVNRRQEAAELFARAAIVDECQSPERVDLAYKTLLSTGQAYAAVELLEQALVKHPQQTTWRRVVLGAWLELQRRDRVPEHLQALIEQRAFDLRILLSATETSSRRMSEATAGRLLKLSPSDLRVKLADVYLLHYRRDHTQAKQVLQQVLDKHPDFAPAHAFYGQVLAELEDWQTFVHWLPNAPQGCRQHARYWLGLGHFAISLEQPAEALRCYWEATRRDMNQQVAWASLTGTLRAMIDSKHPSRAPRDASWWEQQYQVAKDRRERLNRLRDRFNDFAGTGQTSQRGAVDVASELFGLGRLWEAEAWTAIATTLKQAPDGRLPALRQAVLDQLRSDRQWIAKKGPGSEMDLGEFPLPDFSDVNLATSRPAISRALRSVVAGEDHLRLQDQTAQWGLQNAGGGTHRLSAAIAPLIQSTGSGGGCMDYDRDGLVDVLVVNAGGRMLENDSRPNLVYRNLGTRFTRVDSLAKLNDTGYGQGLAVGDFNQDGFQDVLYTNLGRNHLFCNNGDGTFTPMDDLLPNAKTPAWCTSACFFDANQDGLTDLFLARYCHGEQELAKPCLTDQGTDGPCHPITFPAMGNQLLMGQPEGAFRVAGEQEIEMAVPGRSLGVLAGMLSADSMELFVANDMTANAIYRSPADSQSPRSQQDAALADVSFSAGVALDRLSSPQASMGIAASDLDLDGDLDLYVTGFGREYNIVYEQVSPGIWQDTTHRLGLVDPTLNYVGWGTDAIDLDNDGVDELIVSNGHIGEFKNALPYAFEAQVFRRNQQGQFSVVQDNHWDDYFAKPHVGRALWSLDVNRDGRKDVMISHVEEPCVLLVNTTDSRLQQLGHQAIGFQLVGRKCNRDATGAVVRFSVNGSPRTLWMLAGDGFECSNQRLLLAGLGDADRVDDVVVAWPDGTEDAFGTLPAQQTHLLIQGQTDASKLDDFK